MERVVGPLHRLHLGPVLHPYYFGAGAVDSASSDDC